MKANRVVLDLERYIPAIVAVVANKLSRGSSAIYRRFFDISVNEWRIISLLTLEPNVTANRICQVIGFDKALVSRSLQVLEERGHIRMETDIRDQRRRTILLTKKGFDLHDKIIQIALDREKRLLSNFSAREIDALVSLLNRLHAEIPRVNAGDPTSEADFTPAQSGRGELRRQKSSKTTSGR
ncbi:MAG: MarR family winged helix-turn-helix transcriptional regulator [Bradyrhizobium sp.]